MGLSLKGNPKIISGYRNWLQPGKKTKTGRTAPPLPPPDPPRPPSYAGGGRSPAPSVAPSRFTINTSHKWGKRPLHALTPFNAASNSQL
uniref:Uncharacterized protein n=1 Tax=Noccaea caerulescens TaxID=107243 RepID=A0A1J3FKR5_NOCCA